MADTLEIFGDEFTNVTGIKATDNNNQIKTYIRPQGTANITSNANNIDVTNLASVNVQVPSGSADLVVTVSYNSGTQMWEPDKTLSEILTAYNNGDEIAFRTDVGTSAVVDGIYQDSDYFRYDIYETSYDYMTGLTSVLATAYTYESNGVHKGTTNEYKERPILQNKSKSYTPTISQQTESVSADNGYDGLDTVNITVNAMPTGTAGTPTATKGTVSNHSVSVTPSVTNTTGYITGSTKTGTAVSVSASELVSGTLSVTSAGTKDVTNYASASIPSGTEGTPTATKGTVSNHSVSVTPSVTNTNGFISGGTKTGTAVTVSASELVSGSETKTTNGTYDVTNLAELVVNVSGGGSSTIQVGKTTKTLSATASSIQFTGLSGNPTSFVITSSADIATNTDGVTAVVYDGTSLHGQTMTTQVTADTGFTKSYSSGTLTVTATTAEFQANEYKLVYTYDGTSSDIHTSDVQVGSGATSITFSSLAGRPIYWSCIFKSDFSTSSGYQRVVSVANDGTSIYGMAMDSSAKAQTSWTATYSGGNLTISSSGTNNGGYFHQPGYYQLTYAVDGSAPQYQTKTVSPSTSQQTVTADSGYDALEEVTVNAMPSMTLPSSTSATSSGTSKATISASSSTQYLNIPTGYNATAQYYTISASGGGTSKNAQTVQGTSRTSSSTLTAIGAEMTVLKTGTYDVYWSATRSNTSSQYTFGTQLYINGTAYGSEQTGSWFNNIQNIHLSNVSLTANQTIRVYGRESRGTSYYIYCGQLTIIEA